MAKPLQKLFAELALLAQGSNEVILAHICRMGELAAEGKDIRVGFEPNDIAAIWDWDISNDLNRVDARGAELFGVPPLRANQGLPNSIYISAVHPDDRERVVAELSESLKGGEFRSHYRIIASGQPRTVFARGHCFLDQSHRPSRFPGAIMELPSNLH